MISNASWTAARVILAMADPIQGLIDRGAVTHIFCNHRAINILFNDGWREEAVFIGRYLNSLNQGTCWADRGWKCFAHYLEPEQGKGLGPWPDAAQECTRYLSRAMRCRRKGHWEKTFFYLGAAVHLVQDLCVPHHAMAVAFNGHQKFEKWVRRRHHLFGVEEQGCYENKNSPGDWLYDNARVARQYYPLVGPQNNLTDYGVATAVLLPLAQRTTAGFLLSFLQQPDRPDTLFPV